MHTRKSTKEKHGEVIAFLGEELNASSGLRATLKRGYTQRVCVCTWGGGPRARAHPCEDVAGDVGERKASHAAAHVVLRVAQQNQHRRHATFAHELFVHRRWRRG